jgi:hypothetical protein
MVRASDGSVLWLHEGKDDCHAGWACHITDDYPGAQCRAWCVDQSIDTVYTADGKDLHIKPDVHRPPEWRGGDVYDTETGLLTRQRDGFSYAADVGGGPMHGSEEIIYCRYGSQSVQIKFNKDAKPYPSRWENRHYRQDVASCGAGYGGFKDVFKVCELGPVKPGIYLACPNSAQTWKVGTQKTVTWASFGAPPRVNIELSTDSGAHWVRLAGNVANSGSQDVWVPATPSTTCRVRVIGAPPAYTSGHFGQEVVVAAPTQALDGVYSSASSVDFTIEE